MIFDDIIMLLGQHMDCSFDFTKFHKQWSAVDEGNLLVIREIFLLQVMAFVIY